MDRFVVYEISSSRFEVWDRSLPEMLERYTSREQAQAHADAALQSYRVEMAQRSELPF